MPIDKATLEAAVLRSGGAPPDADDAASLLSKLAVLDATGHYGQLLETLAAANDKANFLAAVLEATFAFQFESAGLGLTYEVQQDGQSRSSIDFLRRSDSGDLLYFELRLLQQDQATAEAIKEQLSQGPFYAAMKDGEGERAEVLRLQSVILSKLQKKDGTPIKFLHTAERDLNVVVVCVSDLILGTFDIHDCMLAMYGDPEVPEHCRRGVFGLFQDARDEYPAPIHALEKSFRHLKQTLHGTMFLFKGQGGGALGYRDARLRDLLLQDCGASRLERWRKFDSACQGCPNADGRDDGLGAHRREGR